MKKHRKKHDCDRYFDGRPYSDFDQDRPLANPGYLSSRRNPVLKFIRMPKGGLFENTAPYKGPREIIVKTKRGGRKILQTRPAEFSYPNLRGQKPPQPTSHTFASEWNAKDAHFQELVEKYRVRL